MLENTLFNKILRLNRKSTIAIEQPLYVEINKLLREHGIKNELCAKQFEETGTSSEDVSRVGALLWEVLVGELNRRTTTSKKGGGGGGEVTEERERVYKFLSALIDSALLDVNLIRNFLNQSILYTATECNDVSLCELLASPSGGGADLFAEDNYRQTPFILAAKKNYLSVLKVFVDQMNDDVDEDERRDKQIRLATYHACYSGNYDVVRFMFERFALTTEALLVHARDHLELEWTSTTSSTKLRLSELNPLHVCCYKASYDIVAFLLDRLHDPAQVNAVVNSPINEYRDSTALEEAFKGRTLLNK